jgi:PST family polysaccharide transporter
MVGATLALGIGNANVYFLNSQNVPPGLIASTTVKAGALLGLVLFAGLAVALISFPSYFGAVWTPLAFLFAMGVACQLNADLLYPILVAQLAAKKMVSVLLSRSGFLLLACAALALFGKLTTMSALLMLSGSFIVGLVAIIGYIKRHISLRTTIDWSLLKRVVAYGVKLSAANLMYLASLNISLFLLRHVVRGDFAALGLYARATTICGLIVLLPRTIAPLLYAKWSMTDANVRNGQVELVARFNFTFGLIAGVATVLLANPLLWLLYGSRFVDAASALRLLAPALVCTALFNVFIQLLASDGKAAVTAWILAGTTIITGVVTLWAAPVLGIDGAAMGVLAGNLFAVVSAIWFCARVYRIRPLNCLLLQRRDVVYGRTALFLR